MRRKSFTIVELVIVVIVVGILATLAFPAYQNFIESQKERACETNLKTIKAALDAYAMDNTVMPASLSSLPVNYLKDAYAKILNNKKEAWKIKLAYFVVGFKERGLVYAQNIPGIVSSTLKCPSDTDFVQRGAKSSYALNSAFAGTGKTSADYRNMGEQSIIAADSKKPVFESIADLDGRHLIYKLGSAPATEAIGVLKKQDIEFKHIKIIPSAPIPAPPAPGHVEETTNMGSAASASMPAEVATATAVEDNKAAVLEKGQNTNSDSKEPQRPYKKSEKSRWQRFLRFFGL